jgi:hypothetical protein
VLDLGRLIAYPLGVVPYGEAGECHTVPGYVACRTSPDTVTVWAY